MKQCGLSILLIALIVLASDSLKAQNNFLGFENFRRANASVDVSVLATTDNTAAINLSYRAWDWSYNIKYQNGTNDAHFYNFPILDENDSITNQIKGIGLIRYLSLGVDRKIFQIGDSFFLDGGLHIFGINRPNGITNNQKTLLEGENLPFDKKALEFDFGFGIGLEASLYLHRYVGFIAGVTFDNTVRNIRDGYPYTYLGLKFYVK